MDTADRAWCRTRPRLRRRPATGDGSGLNIPPGSTGVGAFRIGARGERTAALPLRPTTRAQVDGYRFVLRRARHAVVGRDARMLHDPLRRQSASVGVGAVVAVLICAGAAVLALLRPAPDVEIESWLECATAPAVIDAVKAGRVDLLVLDGEAAPLGGLGLCRQLKHEVFDCPPVIVLTGRPQDAWLATWSRAEAAVPHPLDPIQLAETVVKLLRAGVPAQT